MDEKQTNRRSTHELQVNTQLFWSCTEQNISTTFGLISNGDTLNRTQALSVLDEVIYKLGTCVLLNHISIEPLSYNGSQVSKDQQNNKLA